MSSILDALRKVEREKAEVTQAVEADIDEAAAERDLIGGTDGRGHMVLHLPPWMLMVFGGAFVLTVLATAGLAWLYLRGPAAAPPVAMVATTPAPVAAPAPKPEPPKPAVVETVPVVKEPEPEVVVAKAPTPKPVVEPVKPEPPKAEPLRVEEPAPPVAKETPVTKPEEEPKTIAKAVEERKAAQPLDEARPVEEAKPKTEAPESEEPAEVTSEELQTEESKKAEKPKTEPAPEPVQMAKVEEMPAPLPEMKESPVVQPTIGEPLKSTPRPAEPIESAVPADTEKADEGAVLPPSEEDRRLIKLNMPRPANKRNPYASAIINLQPVFLNEMIPGTTAKLITVEEKGVIILKQDTGTRHFIPF